MSLSSKKRRQIADGNRDGWIMMDEDSIRTKYFDELIDSLEIWMENNEMVCHNPCKGEEITKRDRQGKIVRDATIGPRGWRSREEGGIPLEVIAQARANNGGRVERRRMLLDRDLPR